MFSRQIFFTASGRGNRFFSSGLVKTTRCGKNNNILRVAMNSAPVNSLSLDLIVDLRKALQSASRDKDCVGIILASSCRVFSAGLDMREMHGTSSDHLVTFWTELQNLLYLLYGVKQAVICEIAGSAPAAGTILAMCCDSRVAAAGTTVGLNESAFGLNVPLFAIALMQQLMGEREAYRAVSLGTLFKSEEAKALGMVDVLVQPDDPFSVQEAALNECEKWIAIPGRAGNKFSLRNDTLSHYITQQQDDINAFVKNVSDPVTQNRLSVYLASLSKKK